MDTKSPPKPVIGPDEASRLVKRYAAEQQIRVELSEEQYKAILEGWDDRDPKLPAQIIFHVKDRTVAELMVAGYRYSGSTCCA